MDLAERRGLDLEVYEPAEDSRLLATVAAERVDGDDLVLDVGTGSGFVAEHVAGATGARVIGSDLNPLACRRARERGVEAVRADLVSPFADGTFDAVLFNPPYLPAGDAEWDDWFAVAVTGGPTGREVIERFVADAGRVLAPGGTVYLLVSTATGVEAVVAHAGEHGFSTAALADDSFPGETLTVLALLR